MAVKTIIIPVAGMGTRLLPATKSIPKELLPIVDKPLIHFIVEELVSAGITEIVLVTHSSKQALENYFDLNFEIEQALSSKSRYKDLELLHSMQYDNLKIMSINSENFSLLSKLPQYVFSSVNELKYQARSRGEDIIDFGMGNPDQPTPRHIIEKLLELSLIHI